MEYDLLIKNGSVIDGTGSATKQADLGIKDGIIVSIGQVEGEALETIDAKDLVVSPGFIDIHTHFDPQLCWDGHATPSIEHGITTVVTGNCSLSLAPIKGKEDVDKIVSMFSVIEDIKKTTLDEAVPFSWQSFPEYLDHIRPKLGINVGALIGHSAIRLFVMGPESQEREATQEEISKMCDIVKEAMRAGALGISHEGPITASREDGAGQLWRVRALKLHRVRPAITAASQGCQHRASEPHETAVRIKFVGDCRRFVCVSWKHVEDCSGKKR